jgi:hypothetical protein
MSSCLKVLFLAAWPVNTSYRMRLDEEIRQIDGKIQGAENREHFDLKSVWALGPSDLQATLMRHKPHIVHFSGHSKKTGEIALEDERRQLKPVDKQALAKLFTILKDNIRVVVLNACYTEAQAEAISEVIDFTIGMSKTIAREAAISFSAAFYQALAFGRSVQEAFDLGKNQLLIDGGSHAEAPLLLVRRGADAAATYLVNDFIKDRQSGNGQSGPLPTSDALRAMLARLIAGDFSQADRVAITRGLIDGTIAIDVNDGIASIAGGPEEAVQTAVRTDQINLSMRTTTYHRVQERLFPTPAGIAPPLPGLIFVGRERALRDVRGLLHTTRKGTTNNRLVVVRGWPGVGKTTLVGVIGRDPEVTRDFPDGVLWTSLNQKPNLLSILAAWGRALGTDELLRTPTLKEATARLADWLRNKQMLLIVDDVWEESDALPFLQARGERCALLVTTRLTALADKLADAPYVLPVLTEESALKLLRLLVPEVMERYPKPCRELVRSLEYLPLALHVAGSLLKTEAKMGWGVSDLVKEIQAGATLVSKAAPLDRAERGRIPTVTALLKKSTDMLDAATRECFASLGAFAPKPATFNLDAMKAVWEVRDPKPIARTLVGHGLLEPLGSGRFQMHALLVAHAKSLCAP